DGKNGTEDLFLGDAGVGGNVGDDGGGDEVALFRGVDRFVAGDEAAFGFADGDVVEDGFVCAFADDGAHVGVVHRIPDLEGGDAFAETVDEGLVDGLLNNDARAGGTLLSAETEGGGDDAVDGFVEIGIGGDDDGVFATHLED